MSDQPASMEQLPPVRRTSALATASFILSLLPFILFLAPAAAVALGLIALRRIDAAREPVAGRGLAIAGVALGAGFLVLTCVLVPLVGGLVALLSGRQDIRSQVEIRQSRDNLRTIANAVMLYEERYGTRPPSLQSLVDGGYIRRTRVFSNMRRGYVAYAHNVDATGFYYYFPLRHSTDGRFPPDAPSAWEKEALGPEPLVNVLFCGGRVEFMEIDELENRLRHYQGWYAAPPRLPAPPRYPRNRIGPTWCPLVADD